MYRQPPGSPWAKTTCPEGKWMGRVRLLKADTTSGFAFLKIPDAIKACCASRSTAALGRVTDDLASTVLGCRAFGLGRSCSGVAQVRLTAAHHDEAVAMHAADDARAVAAGVIMATTLGRRPNAD
jgi:hypothetical protein